MDCKAIYYYGLYIIIQKIKIQKVFNYICVFYVIQQTVVLVPWTFHRLLKMQQLSY